MDNNAIKAFALLACDSILSGQVKREQQEDMLQAFVDELDYYMEVYTCEEAISKANNFTGIKL